MKMKGRRSVANPKYKTRKDIPVTEKVPVEKKNPEKNGRFVRASEKEMQDLEFESKAKRTHQATKWGITTLTGKTYFSCKL